MDVAEARDIAGKVRTPQLNLAVEASEGAAPGLFHELGTCGGVPDDSDRLARAMVVGRCDSSSLRLFGRELGNF